MREGVEFARKDELFRGREEYMRRHQIHERAQSCKKLGRVGERGERRGRDVQR